MQHGSEIPKWNLDPVFPGFGSEKYKAAKDEYQVLIAQFLQLAEDSDSAAKAPAAWLAQAVAMSDALFDLGEELGSYVYAKFSTETTDPVTMAELNSLDEIDLPLHKALVAFRNTLVALLGQGKSLAELCRDAGLSEPYVFVLDEQVKEQFHQMPPELEDLAADLQRSGGDAWSRLQEAVSSTMQVVWEGDETKTVVQLRGLAHDPDRKVRQKAFRKEIEAWRSMEIPLAASLNGVKGTCISLEKRRAYEPGLQKALVQNRITDKALQSLVGAMKESLPDFREYFRVKAGLLGLPRLDFYDIFAPLPLDVRKWTFPEAREFIVSSFSEFSGTFADFAKKAFDSRWIDGESRKGKVGGAYCTSFPKTGESRVLCNFDGSFNSVSTIAHELGHAFHHEIMKDIPALLRRYPMTLAETASIFAENLAFSVAVDRAKSDREKLFLLELSLSDEAQVIVDILSRFLFESKVFEERAVSELSAERFCELMVDAQKQTYGDALEELHPYMWAVKSHYYRVGLSFYNFPYAFGLLFGLGIYGLFLETGKSFAPTYAELLRKTGRMSAVQVARESGFDIESEDFWRSGLNVVRKRIKTFIELAGKA